MTTEHKLWLRRGMEEHDQECEVHPRNRHELEPRCSCYLSERRELLAEVERLEAFVHLLEQRLDCVAGEADKIARVLREEHALRKGTS